MELLESNISCGVRELTDVGYEPEDNDYYEAMRYSECAVVVASVPAKWTGAVRFLKRKGFKQAHRASRNPNSGNMIVLLSKTITAKDRTHFKAKARKLDAAEDRNDSDW